MFITFVLVSRRINLALQFNTVSATLSVIEEAQAESIANRSSTSTKDSVVKRIV